jgi:diguanylate cyclase
MTPLLITLTLSTATAIIFIAIGIAIGTAWSQARIRRLHDALDRVQDTEVVASDLHNLAGTLTAKLNARTAQLQSDRDQLRQLAEQPVGDSTSAAVLRLSAKMVEDNERLESGRDRAEAELDRQSQLLRSHRNEARTDSLTELANRRAFDDELAEVLADRDQNSAPAGLALIDIDHFKAINDAYGHDAGDEVLRRIGACLAGAVRESDFIFRYGGEEFALIMPGVRREEAIAAAERYRKLLAELVVEVEGTTLRITSSQGVSLAQPDDQPRSLTKRADAALYSAKHAGRNRTHFHDGRRAAPAVLRRASSPGKPAAEMQSISDELRQALVDLAR